jgi:hypothetical protein
LGGLRVQAREQTWSCTGVQTRSGTFRQTRSVVVRQTWSCLGVHARFGGVPVHSMRVIGVHYWRSTGVQTCFGTCWQTLRVIGVHSWRGTSRHSFRVVSRHSIRVMGVHSVREKSSQTSRVVSRHWVRVMGVHSRRFSQVHSWVYSVSHCCSWPVMSRR